MIVLKPPVEKQELVFGDFVSLHIERNERCSPQAAVPKNHLMHYEGLFQRIRKERGELKAAGHAQTLVMHVDNRQRGILPNTLPRRRAG
jgi:hypothetical protein